MVILAHWFIYCLLLYFILVFVHYLIEQSVIFGLVIALYSSIFTVNFVGRIFLLSG